MLAEQENTTFNKAQTTTKKPKTVSKQRCWIVLSVSRYELHYSINKSTSL